MELELTVWQRVMMVTIVQTTRCNDVKMLRLALRALDALEFSEEEREVAGLVEEAGQMRWKLGAAETAYTLELEKPILRFVRNAAEAFQGWQGGQAAQALDLLGKLGVKVEDDAEDN